MSARRSGRAKAPVKYTSASEGSDFEDKKPRKSVKATPKKRSKADQEPADTAAATPKKRTKKDAETLAAEHRDKAAAQDSKAAKAAHKKSWDDWVEQNALPEGEGLLGEEPSKAESITQTDAGKKYGLKKEELGSLKHFEKRNPLHNNTMKLYLEAEVRALGFRKAGMLDGAEESAVLQRGEELWKEEHNDEAEEETEKNIAPKAAKQTKPKTPKQKWTAYIESHSLSSSAFLAEEPADAINQSDCKSKYDLLPADLAVLPCFRKPNPKYGNTTKLFEENNVKALAYKKAAILGGVEESDEGKSLEKGRELFEEKQEKKAEEKEEQ